MLWERQGESILPEHHGVTQFSRAQRLERVFQLTRYHNLTPLMHYTRLDAGVCLLLYVLSLFLSLFVSLSLSFSVFFRFTHAVFSSFVFTPLTSS